MGENFRVFCFQITADFELELYQRFEFIDQILQRKDQYNEYLLMKFIISTWNYERTSRYLWNRKKFI